MELVIGYPQLAYEVLERIDSFKEKQREDSREPWQRVSDETDSQTQRLLKVGGMKFGPAELCEPLEFMALNVNRFIDIYRLSFHLVARDDWAFNGMTGTLQEKVEEFRTNDTKYGFLPTTDKGTGHLFRKGDERKSALISIIEYGKNGNTRVISIGDAGSIAKKFEQIDFLKDMHFITAFANVYLQACYENLARLKKIPEVPEGTIYLNP
ncbi:MAG: hypothetical protein Q8O13_01430 [Candidatus Omnitrophota bacterium]|nr:hypothetical protein [Candidatus Omnitrophota bacterium]